MHTLAHLPFRSVTSCLLAVVVSASYTVWCEPSVAQSADAEPAETSPSTTVEGKSNVGSLFEDFLHYARMGRFQQARTCAVSLLRHPDLDPVELLAIADRDRRSLETLITVINNSSLGEEAKQVLEVLREGEHRKRQNPKRINANIEKLGGSPQAEYHAIQNLIDSGEYAVPWMLQGLMDQQCQRLWPRITRAMPQIGQPAVNPLVVALAVSDRNLRQGIIRILGEIGYPHAVPYLKKLLASPGIDADTRAVADQALGQIAQRTGRFFRGSAADEFIALGERHYSERGSLRADPRNESANVWYWRDSFVDAVGVPREIYGPVMAMRCAEEALFLEPSREEAISLWLAANIRREARLGMDVESGETVENKADATRPSDFPRAIYFSRSAGARYCLEVLDRALRDQDTSVALGSIAALRTIGGESSLVGFGGSGQPLVKALQFPSTMVRIKAALALARVRPKSPFPGAQWVIPALSEALGQTGQERFVVIDPDKANLNRIMELLRQNGAEVVGDTDFHTAVQRARQDLGCVSGMFISAGLESPSVRRGVDELRRDFLFRMTPIVLLRRSANYEIARNLAAHDRRIAHLAADADGAELTDTMREVMARSGSQLPDPREALNLAMETADALLLIGLDGRTVLNVTAAEPALLMVLGGDDDEQLRRKVAAVLALSRTQGSQRALAEVALDDTQSETLRMSLFANLADSAKLSGNLLSSDMVSRLVEVSAEEPNLTLRTAASRALGALNLTNNQASEIIRKHYRG
ncbi:MAG: HEAT repeat domain-containing protein [Phycisphaerae bacterium]|nr:HEAT repeat domain-containing protein [Phycisphaerae bacterium]